MIEVADIFRQYGDDYQAKHELPLSTIKVMRAITSCRTSEMGGHVDQCADCGYMKISYNSCRNRHCPKCQNLPKERWLEDRKKDLMPIHYFHIVFTMPSELHALALRNKKVLYTALFKASSETLIELAGDPKYLGAQIGFISILHTWGQNIMDHPHVHCIVTGGGLTQDETRWINSKKNFFIPVKVMSSLFRGKFLFHLKQANDMNELKYTESIQFLQNESEFRKLLDQLYRKEWVVYCKPPFHSPAYVLTYLGRYTHKIAISNHRIERCQNGQITFKWRDYKDNGRNKQMTLPVFEFIRRFLLHILPQRFVKIRHYGILSNRNRDTKLKRCKSILLRCPLETLKTEKTKEKWTEFLLRTTGIDLTVCPSCGKGHMFQTQTLQPRCYSPPIRKISVA